jgi:hypothetical protein
MIDAAARHEALVGEVAKVVEVADVVDLVLRLGPRLAEDLGQPVDVGERVAEDVVARRLQVLGLPSGHRRPVPDLEDPEVDRPAVEGRHSGRHSETTRARSSMLMPTPPPLLGCTITSQRSAMPPRTSLKRLRSDVGRPVSGSRTWTCTIAAPAPAPAACAPTAESTMSCGVTGIAALWPGTLIPPVIAQEQKTRRSLMPPPRPSRAAR